MKIVELRGIEPLTFSMRTRRATNCAIAPCGSGEPRCDTVSGGVGRLRIVWLSWADAGVAWMRCRYRPGSGSGARGSAHIAAVAAAQGAGGGGVEGFQMFEHGVFVVGLDEGGATA